jgi:hypothetical protein
MGIAPSYVVDVTRRYMPSAINPCSITAPLPISQSAYEKNATIKHKMSDILEREDDLLSVLASQQMPTSLAGYVFHSFTVASFLVNIV